MGNGGRRGLIAVGIVLAFAAVLGIGGSSQDGIEDPRIVDTGVHYSEPYPASFLPDPLAAGAPLLDQELFVCLDRPGRVRVDAVVAVSPQAVVVDGFAIAPRYGGHAYDYVTEPPRAQWLDRVCRFSSPPPDWLKQPDGPPYSAVLKVKLHKPTDAAAGILGYRIDYTSGGHKYSTFLGMRWQLCAPADAQGPFKADCPHDWGG